MSSRTPPLLEPHLLSLPQPSSLTLLTSVLGASTNWLLTRHLHALLKPSSPSPTTAPSNLLPLSNTPAPARGPPPSPSQTAPPRAPETSVLFLSLLRDLPFWRETEVSGARGGGVDLDLAAARKHFAFVDGLSSLGLGGGTVAEVRRTVLDKVGELKRGGGIGGDGEGRKVVLVVDGLDYLLAVAGGSAVEIKDMLAEWREHTHAAIVTVAADDPLIKEQETTLGKQHAWFALSLAHEADTLLSLRLLDTGAARDVSGVIRITHHGDRADDHEYLYYVGGDGGVRVFERGQ
ncbi:hypothetical protein C8A05DRAFT_42005 [Staphylotrichum tortipilum]|uniref:Uncharacterized protein n=1 Tax=Staphylotrichum tortipilum TaxID=2831512 RepID=A0AAN6MR96_9PEZI|nr:hypothetical protein C8A05DRAFT_42005 [Staphylotrichum longicolle]